MPRSVAVRSTPRPRWARDNLHIAAGERRVLRCIVGSFPSR